MELLSLREERELNRGREEGREQGLEQGLEQGQRLGRMRLLQRQLTRRYGDLPAWAVERLERADVDQLDEWGDRLFDAKTLEDLLA